MPEIDIFLYFIIWDNEVCLDKVTVHSELETLLFIFLAAFHLFCQRHGSSSFMMSKSVDRKLLCMWLEADFLKFDLKNKRTGIIVRYLDDAEMLEEKAVHGSLLEIIVCFFKYNFEPEYLLFVNYFIWLMVIVDMMTSWLHF